MSGEETKLNAVGASCANCVFPLWVTKPGTAQVVGGFCRRNPPQVIVKMREGPLAGQVVQEITPQHPPIALDSWCGEHMTREEFVAMKAEGLDDETPANT